MLRKSKYKKFTTTLNVLISLDLFRSDRKILSNPDSKSNLCARNILGVSLCLLEEEVKTTAGAMLEVIDLFYITKRKQRHP